MTQGEVGLEAVVRHAELTHGLSDGAGRGRLDAGHLGHGGDDRQRLRDVERLWELCAELVAKRGLPDRMVPAVVDAARGFRLRNSSYRRVVVGSEAVELSDHTASRDLRALVDRAPWGGGIRRSTSR